MTEVFRGQCREESEEFFLFEHDFRLFKLLKMLVNFKKLDKVVEKITEMHTSDEVVERKFYFYLEKLSRIHLGLL